MFGKFCDSEEIVGRKGMSKGEKSRRETRGCGGGGTVTDSGFNVIRTEGPWKVDRR